MMRPFPALARFLLPLVALLATLPAQAGSLVLNYKNGDKTGWYRQVSIQTSTVFLSPTDPILVNLSDKTTQDYFQKAITDSNIAKNNDWKNRLTFQTAAKDLTGTFYIDVDYAQHSTNTTGGAQFLVRYVRGDGETDAFIKSLQWVQVIKTDSPNGREPGPYIDVYNSGYPRGQALPFYYNQAIQTKLDPNPYVGTADILTSSYNLTFQGQRNPTNLKYDLSFWDWPQRDPNNSWRAGLFLASYTPPPAGGGKGTVTMYKSGVFWGFGVQMVPEPPSLILTALAAPLGIIVALLRRRPRRSIRPGKTKQGLG
jgi:hypothetical protein